MSSLYELKDLYLSLIDMDAEDDLSFAEAIKNSLDDINDEFSEKVINIIKYEKNCIYEAIAIKEEAKKMLKRAEALENKSKRLKEYVRENMLESGIKKVECPYFVVQTRSTASKVVIDNQKAIPPSYIKTEIKENPDKKLIKEAINNGVAVDGCHLESSKTLVIR